MTEINDAKVAAMPEPTSDPGTWVRVTPNTVMASAAALRLAADRFGSSGFRDDGDACAELAARLERALKRWGTDAPSEPGEKP